MENFGGSINRREFMARSAAAAAVTTLTADALGATDSHFHAIPDSPLPKRPYGKSGAQIPILTFGCGSRWLMYKDVDEALRVMNHAIDSGVIYLDTAHSYGDGQSEERIGMLMPARRKDVLIQTKLEAREPDQWWRELETSLKRLKTDYVDTLLIHSVGGKDDLAKIEAKGGPAELLLKAKEQKLARWVGASSHTNGSIMATFLSRHPVDGCQMALNVATNGPFDMGFEENALPVAVEKGLGIIAMKVMGQDQIVNKYDKYDYRTAIRYSLSLPVSSVTIGHPKPDYLDKNLEVVRTFKPFTPREMNRIKSEAAKEIRVAFNDYMCGHRDIA